MGKVFFSVSMSLDGFIAPEGMDMDHFDDPGYKDWLNQWQAMQRWVFPQKFFRESLKLGEGGETGRDNQIIEQTFARTGVSILGCLTAWSAAGRRKLLSIRRFSS